MQFDYLSELDLPTTYTFDGYTIGGLSGIDYDPATGTYIAESDHGANGKANAIYSFTLSGNTEAGGTPGIVFGGVLPLTHDDSESVRFDPDGDGYWYTTESNPPAIYHLHADGSLTTLVTPTNIATRFQTNYSFEGSTFTPDGTYFVSMEDSLAGDQTGLTRITAYSASGQVTAQFAYQLDNLPNIANPPDTLHGSNNGVSDILAVDDTHLLVLERGFDGTRATASPIGVSHNSIRIYEVDLTGAQDVQSITDITSSNATALPKTLLFDSANLAGTLDTYADKVDNIEGMSWGANTADGHRTLVLVNDDNYAAGQGKTQFITLELDDAACYLPGTLIRTSNGLLPVEQVVPGTEVMVFDGASPSTRPVVWTGRRNVRVGHGPNRMDHHPVRIAAGAIAAGVPTHDLLVTSEHAIFLDHMLVPARMLVNGASIIVETHVETYTVHHFETGRHAIVSANGVLSETYLDTGNRSGFADQRGVIPMPGHPGTWTRDAAAALVTDRQRIEPIWRRLAERAGLKGPGMARQAQVQHDPAFAVCAADGTALPMRTDGAVRIVSVPAGLSAVWLLSRTSRPSEVHGPFVDDRRRLGVLVGAVSFRDRASAASSSTDHLQALDPHGWHPLEHSGAASRWTDGCAVLGLPGNLGGGDLRIELLAAGPYVAQPAPVLEGPMPARIA